MAIAFVGSVFSPYYWRARRRGRGDPLEHCALNIALYGSPGRWAMTERGASSVERSPDRLRIGPSGLAWNGTALVVDVHETSMPLPRPVVGRIVLTPRSTHSTVVSLDPDGLHRWHPLAPCARIEVDFEEPRLRWTGHAYLDANDGDEPIENGFSRWTWSRAPLRDQGTAVLYEAFPRRGAPITFGRRFAPDGSSGAIAIPPSATLPRTGWRIERTTRTDAGRIARIARTLEDTPFYARSLVDVDWHGEPVRAVHESLSLDRFSSGWVRALLPFRMPRN